MKPISFSQRIRYKFDQLMSKGPIAMIALLAILSCVVVVTAGAVLALFQITPEGSEPMNFIEGVWQSLMRTLDSGTMGGDAGWGFRIVAFIVTLGGIFIISTLIGVLSSGIEGMLDELRKGKSFVIESNHILILGWSTKIFPILSELILANENKKNACIVILADKDKVEMEDEIRNKIDDFKNTKIICRRGIPNDLTDLAISNPLESKAIIVLAMDSGNSDPLVIKTILALTNSPDRRSTPYHIVAEIKDKKNLEVARMVGKDEVELILTDDIIGRIMVQTSRQSGLSIVLTELLDFNGDEIYFKHENSLIGKTFGEVIFNYEDSLVIGLQYKNEQVKINPPMDYVIQQGDQLIAISEDDDTISTTTNPNYAINDLAIVDIHSKQIQAERILLLGWNERAAIIIQEMDHYVGPNSYMKVVSHYDYVQDTINQISVSLKNISVEFQHDDTTSRSVIDGLDITSFDSIQLLSYKDEMELEDADAHTLISLLHIRRISEETGKDMKIVSEMLSLRNRELAEVTKADDFIVSDNLISLLMAQISENKYLMRVFEDLFSATGSEIYLKPMSEYIKAGEQVNFYTVLESAKRKGQIAIGYRKSEWAHDSQHAYGIILNPAKSKELQFGKDDRIIVLAEE